MSAWDWVAVVAVCIGFTAVALTVAAAAAILGARHRIHQIDEDRYLSRKDEAA
jgi:hypothetical protein